MRPVMSYSDRAAVRSDSREGVPGGPAESQRPSPGDGPSPDVRQILQEARVGRAKVEREQRGNSPRTRRSATSGAARERLKVRSSGGLGGHYYPSVTQTVGPMPLLVAVHGVTRNRGEIVQELLHHVPDDTAVLLPFFSQKRFRGYQRLEPGPEGADPSRELLALLDEVERITQVQSRVSLFGFSGGAQFAHRFTMLFPERVVQLIAVAAGFYTMPVAERDFPYGLRAVGALSRPITEDDWRRYLECPKHVLVGELDTDRDRHLRQDDELDRAQGRDRVERARRYAFSLRALEIRVTGRPRTRFVLLRRSGHSLRSCVKRGGLGRELAGILRAATAVGPVGEQS